MAKQKGIIKIDGTVGDLTFYRSKDGYIAKEKSEISKRRILSDPAFIRTRENAKEFGASAKMGKLLRMALKPMLFGAADGRITSRVTSVMSDIRKLDTVSTRGNRTAAIGIQDPQAIPKLLELDFNVAAPLTTIIGVQMNADGTGVTDFGVLIPLQDILYPEGATHFSLSTGWANINLLTSEYDLQLSPITNLAIDGTSTPVSITVPTAPTGSGFNFHLVKVEFFQEINGIQYVLKNGAHNALGIIRID